MEAQQRLARRDGACSEGHVLRRGKKGCRFQRSPQWPCPLEAGAGSRLASVDMVWVQLVEARGTRGRTGTARAMVRV